MKDEHGAIEKVDRDAKRKVDRETKENSGCEVGSR